MNLVCVLSIYSFNFIMRIADEVIDYVYDDVSVYADDNGYVYRYLYMHEP